MEKSAKDIMLETLETEARKLLPPFEENEQGKECKLLAEMKGETPLIFTFQRGSEKWELMGVKAHTLVTDLINLYNPFKHPLI